MFDISGKIHSPHDSERDFLMSGFQLNDVWVELFEDGTIDIQTYIDPHKLSMVDRFTLRSCFEIRPDGYTGEVFPLTEIMD